MIIEIDWMQGDKQVTVIDFIIENKDQPEEFWQSFSDMPIFKNTKFANWYIMDGEIVTAKEASKRYTDFIIAFSKDDTIPYVKEGNRIDFELVQNILDLVTIGGIELKELKR